MVKYVILMLELRKSFFVSMEMDKGNLKGKGTAQRKNKNSFFRPRSKKLNVTNLSRAGAICKKPLA